MAQKSSPIPLAPVQMTEAERLATEAAQEDAARNIERVSNKEQSADTLQKRKKQSSISIDVSDIIPTKQTRLTRTFTLSPEVDEQLDEASRRLKTPRSTILEKAFVAWWNAVQKTL